MRFLGRKWQIKNNGKNKGNKISRFALRATFGRYTPERATALAGDPVFGRAVAPSARRLLAGLEAPPFRVEGVGAWRKTRFLGPSG